MKHPHPIVRRDPAIGQLEYLDLEFGGRCPLEPLPATDRHNDYTKSLRNVGLGLVLNPSPINQLHIVALLGYHRRIISNSVELHNRMAGSKLAL